MNNTLSRWLKCASIAIAVTMLAAGAARAAETVVVYNAIGTEMMQAFVDGFQKLHPDVNVQVISGGSGELITRIKAESGNPQGDVLLGPDADNFDAMIELFDSYKSKEDAAFGKGTAQPDHKYYGFSMNFQAFIVNTKMMPVDSAPKSWADLAKPEYKGKIMMANPAQSGSAYSQMHQILMLYGWDMMQKIVSNATFVPSSKLAYQNVAKGEFPVGLTSEFNILKSKLEGFPVEAVYPSDGTAQIIDASGIIKGAPHLENAKLFLDYINSKPAHELLVEIDKRRSARADVAPPPGLAPISDIKTFPYDSIGAAKDHTKDLELFDQYLASK
jgi:iron(III) transport system substrate-binding protein